MVKKKVLIVDDSLAIAHQLRKIVDDSEEFEVVGHAKNGIEGVKLYASLRPDIVCMDLVMPEMDGLQAIRALIGIDKNAKILVISSAAGVGEKAIEALKFGAKNIITKPFEPATIVEILKKL
ncbi:MAG: response regulator [Thermodesulfovibrionales bacterium]|jgi:two-component system chemotaxis response regulator CheY